jgi:hypothetical protein
MSKHSHDVGSQPWPFGDADNTAAFTCRHVLEGSPILRVTHDEDDGAWQFLCGQSHQTEDAKIVCLGCMAVRDTTLLRLADLPLGWCADRDDLDSQWVRSQNPLFLDGDDHVG